MQQSKRKTRRKAPLEEHTQGELRRLIRLHASAEIAARALALPLSTLLAGAAGAPMLAMTRRRLRAALDKLPLRPPKENGTAVARVVPLAQPKQLRHLRLVDCSRHGTDGELFGEAP